MTWSTICEQIERQPRWLVLTCAVILGGCVGCFDALLREQLSLRVLFVPLIALTAWLVGVRIGLVLSVWAALLWPIGNWYTIGSALFAVSTLWETATRLIVFGLVAVLSSRLHAAMLRERKLARCDSLTGLSNSKSFLERAEAEMNRSRRTAHPLTMVFIDGDQFKSINDSLGHLVGDELLKTIATTLRSETRSYDVVARLGGDEFALLLPETTAETARMVVERVRTALQKTMETNDWPVTFSMGAVTFCEVPESAPDMISAADKLMYAAKQEGTGKVKYDVVAAAIDSDV